MDFLVLGVVNAGVGRRVGDVSLVVESVGVVRSPAAREDGRAGVVPGGALSGLVDEGVVVPGPEVDADGRLIMGERNGFLSVALAASTRRRLAAGPGV